MGRHGRQDTHDARRHFKPGFRLQVHIKHRANAPDTAHILDAPVPRVSRIMEIRQALKAQG
jgi:hypothetical protein